jgi:hypothetical protein
VSFAQVAIVAARVAYGAFCSHAAAASTAGSTACRSWLAAGAISALDPMLGEGTFLARFAGNTWLVMLAAWARIAGVEPSALYERAAPLLLAPLAVSAAALATRAVLESRRLAVTGVVVATLFWTSGSMFPALTRLPEDKLVAAIIVAPVLCLSPSSSSRLRAAARPRPDRPGESSSSRRPRVARDDSPAHRSARHPAPALFLRDHRSPLLSPRCSWRRRRCRWRSASRRDIVAEGESLAAADHPVCRIHLACDRGAVRSATICKSLRACSRDRSPRSRSSPVLSSRPRTARCVLLALPTARPRRVFLSAARDHGGAGGRSVDALSLSLAAVRPVARARRRLRRSLTRIGTCHRSPPPPLAAPHAGDAIRGQSGPIRAALATPTSGALPALAEALRELPADSVIAAPPELSERIPGLTGRRVLAASDRATVVFARSRESAALRLQSRAAVLAGLWRATEGAPIPTHVVFEPGAPASRYCAREIFATTSHVLCEFAARDVPPGLRLYDAPADPDAVAEAPRIGFLAASEAAVEGRVECRPQFTYGTGVVIFPRPGPWSARAPSAVWRTRRC